MPTKKIPKVRYAVVGQGYFAQIAVLPAFAHSKRSQLAALVSDDPAKLERLGKEYGVERLVGYGDYDALCASGDIDAVYIALPNSMHREYAERAARVGVHVLCEKPLAVTEADCQAMINACEDARVKLMTAYRLHFEEANLTAIELARAGKLGDLRLLSSVFTMNVKPGNIRLDRTLGGGPLWDIGIYCINGARSMFRAEPIEVFAIGTSRRGDTRFAAVHEMVSGSLRFPEERLATFSISFGGADVSAYDVVGTKGSVRVNPAYELARDLTVSLRADGKVTRKTFRRRDQVAPEISYFSECIQKNKEPEPSGREGLADVRVIQALYRSMKEGEPVTLDPFDKLERPDLGQEQRSPLGRERELFHAEPPSTSP